MLGTYSLSLFRSSAKLLGSFRAHHCVIEHKHAYVRHVPGGLGSVGYWSDGRGGWVEAGRVGVRKGGEMEGAAVAEDGGGE